jgi:Protein of unknown function (DUF742)
VIPPDDADPAGVPATPAIRPFLAGGPMPAGPAPAEDDSTALRPFVITSGRVDAPDPGIGLETQVTALPGAASRHLPPEQRAIVSLCAEPQSVAEISAQLRLHLGVVRILVGDLRAAGRLDVQVLDNSFPDPDTIRRVIRGLRAIP